MYTTKPTVTASESCDRVATGPGAMERIKALGKSFTARSRMALVMVGGPVLVACGAEAQDAPKTKLMADASAAVATAATKTEAPAPKTETPVVKVSADGKLDLAALMAQAQAKKDNSATELADKTAEADKKTTEADKKIAEANREVATTDAITEVVETLGDPSK